MTLTDHDMQSAVGRSSEAQYRLRALAKAAAAPCPYKDECDRKGEHVAPNCPPAAADEGDL